MCPRRRGGVCEVVGIEPEYIECADSSFCYKNIYMYCRVYITEYLMNRKSLWAMLEQNEEAGKKA